VHFGQPRRRKIWNLPAEANFGIANKSTVFGSAAQRKFWKCDRKHCILFSRAAKTSEIANKSILLSPGARRKFLNRDQKSAAQWKFVQPRLFGLRSENFGIYQQKQLKLTAFCSAAQPKI
jgi:hypothetical protein